MALAIWQYTCDFSHDWEIIRDENAQEHHEDSICPDGHEAAILKKLIYQDIIRISLIPQGLLVDDVKNKFRNEDKYKIEISDNQNPEDKLLSRNMGFDEAYVIIKKFRNLNKIAAWKLFNELNLK